MQIQRIDYNTWAIVEHSQVVQIRHRITGKWVNEIYHSREAAQSEADYIQRTGVPYRLEGQETVMDVLEEYDLWAMRDCLNASLAINGKLEMAEKQEIRRMIERLIMAKENN